MCLFNITGANICLYNLQVLGLAGWFPTDGAEDITHLISVIIQDMMNRARKPSLNIRPRGHPSVGLIPECAFGSMGPYPAVAKDEVIVITIEAGWYVRFPDPDFIALSPISGVFWSPVV